ncbi:hypothetical protein LUZ62_043394 [Rhynchospora pubera]|uniref:Uncharacterized protein n=1 Tax=Rhynchospora pubera TaxID=906938 RepID=A0AAV8FFW2_9POAL|nr:hypothetical protein LUZ62_043394 [Rhynchospora pubera]
MEEEILTSTEEVNSKASDKPLVVEVEEKPTLSNGDSKGKEEDDEFIKVDKELIEQSREMHTIPSTEIPMAVKAENDELEKLAKLMQELESERNTLKNQIIEAETKHNLNAESLKEALNTLEKKEAELHEVKELFNAIQIEHENSTKKAEEEAKKASELERMLEVANASLKELESKVSDFHGTVMEKEQIEESLKTTLSELESIKETLEVSKFESANLTEKIIEKEVTIEGLNKEIALHKSNEDNLRENVSELEKKILDLKGENETLESTINDLKLELSQKEEIHGHLEDNWTQEKEQHTKTRSLLSETLSHKEELEFQIGSLTEQHGEAKVTAATAAQRVAELENLVQALNANEEVLKSLVQDTELKLESSQRENAAFQCKIEGYESKIQELEASLDVSQSKVSQLEQQLGDLSDKLAENQTWALSVQENRAILEESLEKSVSKVSGLEMSLQTLADKEKELQETISQVTEEKGRLETEVTGLIEELNKLKEEKRGLDVKLLEKEDDHVKSRSLLSEALLHREQLELHVKSLEETHSQRSLELETLISSEREAVEAKLEIAQREISELKEQVGDAKSLVVEREQEIKLIQKQLHQYQAEARELESSLHSSQSIVSHLEKELEGLSKNLANHHLLAQSAQEIADQKIAELELTLSNVREEKASLESTISAINEKLAEKDELELHLSSLKESHQKRDLELCESGTKLENAERENIHLKEEVAALQIKLHECENKMKELETSLHEALYRATESESEKENLSAKFSEYQLWAQSVQEQNLHLEGSLHSSRSNVEIAEKRIAELELQLQDMEQEIQSYKDMLSQVSEEKRSLKEDLEHRGRALEDITSKKVDLEGLYESLVKESEEKLRNVGDNLTSKEGECAQLEEKVESLKAELEANLSQIEILAATNTQLREELDLHGNKLSELHVTLTGHERGLNEREVEAKSLNEKIIALEVEARTHLEKSEDLKGVNTSLSEELRKCTKKLGELETAYGAVMAEKEELIERTGNLHSQVEHYKGENEDLLRKYEKTKEELEDAIEKLNGEVNVQRSETQLHISKLEKQHTLSEQKYMEEIKSMQILTAEKEDGLTAQLKEHESILLEKETVASELAEVKQKLDFAYEAIKQKEEEASFRAIQWETSKKDSLSELEKQVESLNEQLQKANKQLKDKDLALEEVSQNQSLISEMEKKILELEKKLQSQATEQTETRSRDIGGIKPTTNQAPKEPSGIMAFRFIIAVAAISIIIGIFLGKKY